MSSIVLPRPGPSSEHPAPLDAVDPSVKLVVLFVISLVLVMITDPVTPAAVWAVAVSAVLVTTRLTPRGLAVAHVPFLLFAVGLLIVNALSRGGEVLLELGPLAVTDHGLSVGFSLVFRTLVIGVCATAFLVSTDPVDLMTSLRQNLRLPASFTYALLAGHELLLDLPSEWETIRSARRMRRGETLRTRLTPREAGASAFTLLIVAIRRSERIARSLESRGLGLHPRTVFRPVPVRGRDLAAGAAVLAVLALLIGASALAGMLAGPGGLVA